MFRRNNVAVVPVEELDFVLRQAIGMGLPDLLSRIDERASEVSSEGSAKISDATSATEAANRAYAEGLAEITQQRDTSLASAKETATAGQELIAIGEKLRAFSAATGKS